MAFWRTIPPPDIGKPVVPIERPRPPRPPAPIKRRSMFSLLSTASAKPPKEGDLGVSDGGGDAYTSPGITGMAQVAEPEAVETTAYVSRPSGARRAAGAERDTGERFDPFNPTREIPPPPSAPPAPSAPPPALAAQPAGPREPSPRPPDLRNSQAYRGEPLLSPPMPPQLRPTPSARRSFVAAPDRAPSPVYASRSPPSRPALPPPPPSNTRAPLPIHPTRPPFALHSHSHSSISGSTLAPPKEPAPRQRRVSFHDAVSYAEGDFENDAPSTLRRSAPRNPSPRREWIEEPTAPPPLAYPPAPYSRTALPTPTNRNQLPPPPTPPLATRAPRSQSPLPPPLTPSRSPHRRETAPSRQYPLAPPPARHRSLLPSAPDEWESEPLPSSRRSYGRPSSPPSSSVFVEADEDEPEEEADPTDDWEPEPLPAPEGYSMPVIEPERFGAVRRIEHPRGPRPLPSSSRELFAPAPTRREGRSRRGEDEEDKVLHYVGVRPDLGRRARVPNGPHRPRNQQASVAESTSSSSGSESGSDESSEGDEKEKENENEEEEDDDDEDNADMFGMTGLENMGNSCFLNAPIQALAATSLLAKYFLDGEYKAEINTKNKLGTKGQLASITAKLIRAMREGNEDVIAPVAFRDAMMAYRPQFKNHDQHDAQELLGYLLDGLHEDLNLVLTRRPVVDKTPEEEAELEELPEFIGADREWMDYRTRNDSVIIDYFAGQFRNKLECLVCGQTSTTFNAFQMLSLPIPNPDRRRPEISLSDCLGEFLREEILDRDNCWNCPRCRQPRPTSKRFSLARLPHYFIFHLKRFSSFSTVAQKVNTPVDFPLDELDLGGYLPPPLPNVSLNAPHGKSTVYELYAVCNHYEADRNGLNGGHYTAMVRNSDNWYSIGDDRVRRVSESKVKAGRSSAYILFYRLQE